MVHITACKRHGVHEHDKTAGKMVVELKETEPTIDYSLYGKIKVITCSNILSWGYVL